MKIFLLSLVFLLPTYLTAQKISGVVKDDKGELLSYCSIIVKGTSTGTLSNENGKFSLNLQPGTYTIVCRSIGYTTVQKNIKLREDEVMNFTLLKEELQLDNVVIKSGAEDPAYAIIRKAIASRDAHDKEVKAYSCDFYTKDLIRTEALPEKFMGQKIDSASRKGMGLDSTGKGVSYLSESLSKLYIQKPDKIKLDVIKSRVSGSNSFGFTFPSLINIYSNNVQVFARSLNPRGFVSPIADGAISFYKFKYLGSFFENGKEINKIQVTPRRQYEPLFTGIININENDWHVHSLQLHITKNYQLEILDSLKIEQAYIPLGTDTWRVKNQVIHFKFNQFGVKIGGDFLSVYSDYNLKPGFSKSFFDKILISYDTAVTRNSTAFLDSLRPIPLEQEEVKDYKVKDSTFNSEELAKQSPAYYDSLNAKRKKIKPLGFFWGGINQTHYAKKGNTSFGIASLASTVEYNFAEGAVIEFRPYIQTSNTKKQSSTLYSPIVRYGLSNEYVSTWMKILHRSSSTNRNSFGQQYWQIAGGKRVSDFNKETSLYPIYNSISAILFGNNFLKTYENTFASISAGRRFQNGFTINAYTLFEDRKPLDNTTDFVLYKETKKNITPNYPLEILNSQFTPHQAFLVSANLSFKPGQRFIQLPNGKIPIGSKYPTFTVGFTKAIKGFFNSDADFDKWSFRIYDDKNLKLAGLLKYNIGVGGFLNNKTVYAQDFTHYDANYSKSDFGAARSYVGLFNLSSYYQYSNTSRFYKTAFLEHHLNGLLTNKIPIIKKLKWNAVAGINYLHFDKLNYVEWFAGLENIFKIFRLDVVSGYENGRHTSTGLRLGSGGLLGRAAQLRGANAESRNTEATPGF